MQRVVADLHETCTEYVHIVYNMKHPYLYEASKYIRVHAIEASLKRDNNHTSVMLPIVLTCMYFMYSSWSEEENGVFFGVVSVDTTCKKGA